MPHFRGVGGTNRRVARQHIGAGGTWRRVIRRWIGVGGQWRLFFNESMVKLVPASVRGVGRSTAQSVVTSQIAFFPNGEVGAYYTENDNVFTPIISRWHDPDAPVNPADFEIRITKINGFLNSQVTTPLNVWLALNEVRIVGVATSVVGETRGASVTVQVRETGATDVLAEAVFGVSVTLYPPGSSGGRPGGVDQPSTPFLPM